MSDEQASDDSMSLDVQLMMAISGAIAKALEMPAPVGSQAWLQAKIAFMEYMEGEVGRINGNLLVARCRELGFEGDELRSDGYIGPVPARLEHLLALEKLCNSRQRMGEMSADEIANEAHRLADLAFADE